MIPRSDIDSFMVSHVENKEYINWLPIPDSDAQRGRATG